ncbi:hypothetical protein [Archaeoglobus sp.]
MKLWDISKILYREILFKSIVETTVRKKPEEIVKSVSNYMWMNKILIAVFICGMSVFVALNPTTFNCSIFLAYLLFTFVFFFLQIVTSFVSHGFDFLHILPLSKRDVSKIKMLTFLRIFDLPLFAVILVSTLAFGFLVSPLSAFWALLGVITAELLAIAIVFRLARFFYSKIAYSTGGWKTLLRIFYMVAWSVSAFGFYFIADFISELPKVQVDLRGWDFVFPICFGYVMKGSLNSIALVSSLTYLAVAVVLFNRTLPIVNERVVVTTARATSISIKPTHPILGILKKDLKLTSRSPAHAMLLLFPIIEGLIFVKDAVLLISMIMVAIVLVVFAAYGVESEFTKILPIDFWTLTAGKTLLLVIVYVVSVVCATVVRSLIGMSFSPIGFAQIPSVVAMGIFVALIYNKFGVKRDIYTGVISFVLILIPCMVLAYTPLVVGLILSLFVNANVTVVSFIVSLTELFAIVTVVKIVV